MLVIQRISPPAAPGIHEANVYVLNVLTLVLGVEWAELDQIWRTHWPIIGTLNECFRFSMC